MGLLSDGEPLSWPDTKKWAQHVREHGIEQFIVLYEKLKERQGDVLKWGDEVGREINYAFFQVEAEFCFRLSTWS